MMMLSRQTTRSARRPGTCGLAALVVLSACTTGSGSASSPTPASTSAPITTIAGFDPATWSAENRDLFALTTSAMTRFAEAVAAGEVEQAQEAASEVRQSMTELAAGLDNETQQEAIDLRDDLVKCSEAYGAADDALTNSDPEAFEDATPLFQACLGIAPVEQT